MKKIRETGSGREAERKREVESDTESQREFFMVSSGAARRG